MKKIKPVHNKKSTCQSCKKVPAVLKKTGTEKKKSTKNTFGKNKQTLKVRKEQSKFPATPYTTRGPSVASEREFRSLGGQVDINAVSNVPVEIKMSQDTLVGLCAGTLSYVYDHGYRQKCDQSATTKDYPFLAFLYMLNLFGSAVSGNQIQVPKNQLPRWIRDVLAAISPKNGLLRNKNSTGTLSYRWIYNGSGSVSSTFAYPAVQNTFNYVFGSPVTSNVLGYNEMLSPSTAYTDQIGGVAFVHMYTFMGNRLRKNANFMPWSLVDVNLEASPLWEDPSSFCATSRVVGDGVPGGHVYGLGSLETKVSAPMFSVFASDVSLDRGLTEHHATSGDTNWLPCSIFNFFREGEYKNSNPVKFKYIHLFEYIDTIARIMARAFQYMYDNELEENKPIDSGITDIEFQILVTQVLKRAFPTQFGMQTLYPVYGGADDMIPLLNHAGTSASITSTTLNLPLYLVENINANISRKGKDRDPSTYASCLFVYAKDSFDSTKYTYNNGTGNVPVIIQTGDSLNIVDGRVNNKYVDLSGSKKIQDDIVKFNKVMARLSPYIQQLTALDIDNGIAGLSVVGRTYMVSQEKQVDNKRRSIEVGVSLLSKKYACITSQQEFVSGISAIQKAMISPEMPLITGQAAVGNIGLNTMQAINDEMHYQPLGEQFADSNGDNYITAEELRNIRVDYCTKSLMADDCAVVKQMMRLSENGEAGILGDVARVLGTGFVNVATSLIPL